MYKKHNYYGGGPVLGRNITIYKCFDNTKVPFSFSPELQQQIINGANADNTYTLDIQGNDITLFNFTLALKELLDINPNLNVQRVTQIFTNTPNENSRELSEFLLPPDNIPQSNIFFVQVIPRNDGDDIYGLMPNPYRADSPANLEFLGKIIAPAYLYWHHPRLLSREETNEYWLYELRFNRFNELDVYKQGVDLTQPNVKTLENFLRLFYSPLWHPCGHRVCPFEYVASLWQDYLSDDGTMNDDDFLSLFAVCDSLQMFRLYFKLLPEARRPLYQIGTRPPIRNLCPIDFSRVQHVNLGGLDLSNTADNITHEDFVAGQDYYRVQTVLIDGTLTTSYFGIEIFEEWINRTGDGNLACRHPLYNVRVNQNDIVRFTYNPPQGGAKTRKSRSYRKKNNKRSIRR
jgi:hypothetical protein